MGLAEPRKRVKLSHDPRNLAWSSQSSSASYGHRLMTRQGWAEGQALGARSPTSSTKSSSRHHSGLSTDAERLAAARVGILFKDDNLGLGAKRKGGKEAVEGQRTGLDAFQGLLGRLNGKGEETLREEEKKVEERKLEMFFRGRWGGMVFVRGGILVGSQGEKDNEEMEKKEEPVTESQSETPSQAEEAGGLESRRRRKEEKRLRKDEKRRRKEERALRQASRKAKREPRDKAASDTESSEPTPALPTHKSPISQPPDEPVSSSPSETEPAQSSKAEKKRIRKSEIPTRMVDSEQSRSSSPSVAVLRNGRHLLRGRNIQAKKMVLADAKGLDQIFMR